MKKNRFINILLLIILILINLYIVFKLNHNKYDVNYDGQTDIKDLLDLQKYLIERGD